MKSRANASAAGADRGPPVEAGLSRAPPSTLCPTFGPPRRPAVDRPSLRHRGHTIPVVDNHVSGLTRVAFSPHDVVLTHPAPLKPSLQSSTAQRGHTNPAGTHQPRRGHTNPAGTHQPSRGTPAQPGHTTRVSPTGAHHTTGDTTQCPVSLVQTILEVRADAFPQRHLTDRSKCRGQSSGPPTGGSRRLRPPAGTHTQRGRTIIAGAAVGTQHQSFRSRVCCFSATRLGAHRYRSASGDTPAQAQSRHGTSKSTLVGTMTTGRCEFCL